MWAKWVRIAFLCRFAHQDIYRLLGRDPLIRPLSVLEQRLFEAALHDILEKEFSPTGSTKEDDE